MLRLCRMTAGNARDTCKVSWPQTGNGWATTARARPHASNSPLGIDRMVHARSRRSDAGEIAPTAGGLTYPSAIKQPGAVTRLRTSFACRRVSLMNGCSLAPAVLRDLFS